MREQRFVIEGCLPSLNDYIRAERATRRGLGAARMKTDCQSRIIMAIRAAKVKPVENPVILRYTHYVPNRRKDRDNIASIVHKFTQDALVFEGIIPNDGWDDILNSIDEWGIDRSNPKTVVRIIEVEK